MRSTSLAAGAAAVLAVAVAGAVPAAASAPVGRAGTPMCTTSQLTGALGGGDAGAGNLYRYLVLTNHSSTTCHLTGYPGVSLLDAAGQQIGTPADRQPSRYAPVVLRPGASASDTIHTVNHMGKCLPASAKVRIYPPGNTASMVVAGSVTNCDNLFTVTPMAAGRNGSDPVQTAPTRTAAPTPTASTGRQVPAVPSGAPDTGLAATGGGHSSALTAGAATAGVLAGGLALAAAGRRRRRTRG